MESLITFLIAIIGGLGFLYLRKSKENNQLKVDKDLTVQSESSKVVDEKVGEAQSKVDDIQASMESEPEEAEAFWEEYTKKKDQSTFGFKGQIPMVSRTLGLLSMLETLISSAVLITLTR